MSLLRLSKMLAGARINSAGDIFQFVPAMLFSLANYKRTRALHFLGWRGCVIRSSIWVRHVYVYTVPTYSPFPSDAFERVFFKIQTW